MGNILRVLKRDLIRLLKAPAALVVVGALLVLPSVYTWYNVVAFWNPYENTGSMRVAVVNLDKGASSELTGQLDVGSTIVDTLHDNTQLSWQFDDYDTAMADLQSGKDYAVFVIPEDFSASLISLTTGSIEKPVIGYYVNEKAGPVSPKVTDTGASTLEQTINSTFISTVADAVTSALKNAVDQSQGSLDQASSKALQDIDGALQAVEDSRQRLASIVDAADSSAQKVQAAYYSIDGAKDSIVAASQNLGDISTSSKVLQERLGSEVASSMESLNVSLEKLSEALGTLKDTGYVDQVNQAIASVKAASNSISSKALPEAVQAMGELSSVTAQVSAIVDEQQLVIDQAKATLDQLDQTLTTMKTAVSQTDGLLASLVDDLRAVRSDVVALSGSNVITSLLNKYNLDAESISDFMGSPTKVVTEQLYPLNAYGSAMAPLFMNLTFWIGAFCLLIIMKQEVDDKGIPNLTFTQRYLARFLLFAVFAVLQALICCAGVMVLGAQVVQPVALFFAASIASLAYLSIIYALSVVLQHIGKGLCIVLVFLQIPAATGLYPIEMTSAFYQTISPLFPFTYGIAAMRECIFGFYGSQYAQAVGMLLVFFAVFLLLGIFTRPLMSNVNLMVAREIKESGVFNGEDVEVPHKDFRFAEVVAILTDKKEYRRDLKVRYERFNAYYPRIIKGSIVAGVAVPVAILLVHSFSLVGKANLLTLWLLWLVCWFIFLVVVENLRYRLETQLDSFQSEEDEGNA